MAYKYYLFSCQEAGGRLFSVVPSRRTNGQKPMHRRSHLSTGKNFSVQ